jgi:DNA-binding transcriptional regulator YhcF (GntR family)
MSTFSPGQHAKRKLMQKKFVAAQRARRSFIESVASAKPTPEVQKRHEEAVEAVSRAKHAGFLQQYRAAAKA